MGAMSVCMTFAEIAKLQKLQKRISKLKTKKGKDAKKKIAAAVKAAQKLTCGKRRGF